MRKLMLLAAIGLSFSSPPARAQTATVVAPEPSFEFPKVVQGTPVEHGFVIRNDGDTPVRIQGLRMTPPLTLGRMPAQIGARQQVMLPVKLDTSEVLGDFEGDIEVVLNDPGQTVLSLRLEGSVVRTIELAPFAAFFAAGSRGKGGTSNLEIINHGDEALRILGIDYSSHRFSVAMSTLEEGKRYRLTLTLAPDGPGGRAAEPIIVRTSNAAQPELKITANTHLRERVYTFPDAVAFGSLPLSVIRSNPAVATQTLMVYRLETSDFDAAFVSDGPFSIAAQRGPNGDRFQATLTLRSESLTPGPISGTITIKTNDREFSTLTVPYTLTVLP